MRALLNGGTKRILFRIWIWISDFVPSMPSVSNPTPRLSPIDTILEWCRVAATTPRQYWLTRFVLLRLLGFLYFVAFLAAVCQLVPLIGHNGLLPVDTYLGLNARPFAERVDGFIQAPTLFWMGCSDGALLAVAWIGLLLSLVVLFGYANSLIMLALWILYTSIVNVGQIWYGFGWEMQLLETGMLAVFLCPLLDGRPFPRRAPPVAVIWLYRWLIFRIMLGAGLIKLRGDACWRDLTCLYYHYETQPIPNPLSWWLHFRPHWFHQAGVFWNHCVELLVPWFGFGPRPVRHVAGVLLVTFQMFLIASGNLSFLNWLTIVPCLACFDDSFWVRLLPRWFGERARRAEAEALPSTARDFTVICYVLIVAILSVAPVWNLCMPDQAMNRSFEPFRLVNTYGAFGSVGRERYEIIFEGTQSSVLEAANWREYEFPAKPGDPRRRPPFIAPYQPRLDWEIWFAAMATYNEHPWTVHLVWKLLHNDPGALSLLANNPFPDAPPHYIRAELYRYRFTPPGENDGSWWKRERVGSWLPPLSADQPDLRRFLEMHRWLPSADAQ